MTRIPPLRALAGAAAALALAVVGCSGGPAVETDADGNAQLTVYHITTADSAPLYLGVEQGFFEEEGLDVTVQIAESGSAIIPSVINGESQIGYANTVSDLAAIDQGLDIRFVVNCCGTFGDTSQDTSGVFVLDDSEIQGPEDLPGTTIAVNSTKNLGDITIPHALQQRGIDPAGIEWVPMNFSDMGAALERGDVDAIWQVEPFRTLAMDAGYRSVLSNFVEATPNAQLGYYITSAEFAEEHPELVQAFQRGYSKSAEYATANEDELRQTAIDEVGVDPDVAQRMNFAAFVPGLDVDSIRTYGALAVEYGAISEEPDYDEYIIQPEG